MEFLNDFISCRALSQGAHAAADGRFSYPGSTPHYAPDRTFDTEHIRLTIELDFNKKTLSGTCLTELRALADGASDMTFDAVDFQIQRVSSKGKTLEYRYSDRRKLQVHLPTPAKRGTLVEISIQYKVTKPKLGLHFVGPDRSYPKKPVQAWTQGEDEYNRYWFPCHDAPQERTTSAMIVTVPAPFTAVSNGALLKASKSGKRRTFHWKHNVPHSPYLISLAVGEFTEIRDHWGKVPVLYYVTPGREEDAKRAFGKTPKMIEFFSSRTGIPYAYAKYSQVAAIDFIYGGMENTSATTQTAMTLHDERAHLDFSSDPLVAHELAHQWFGDLVTCKDWSHAWLNESFATYFEALFKEFDMGYDEFMYELHGNAQAYFDEDRERYRRPLVTRFYKNTNDLFDRHLYEKGSLILHMIRKLLGDEAWWRSINLYLTRHKTQSVETVDLIQAIQDATGRNFRPFFDQWVFKGGHPEYKVRYWWDARAKKANVRVLQTHSVNEETGLFTLPVTIAFWIDGKEKRFTETVSGREHLFTFELSSAPELVLFDPDHTILKKIDFAKPESMWMAQLIHDPHVLGRLQAAQNLGALASPAAVLVLRQALLQEKFWAVQGEIARALGKAGSNAALEALLDGLKQVQNPKARRAVIEAVGNYISPRALGEIRQIHESEKSYFTEGEALRTLGRMRDPAVLSLLKGYLQKESWNDVLRCAALEAIASLQLDESISILKEHCRYGHSANARMTAIRRLAAFGRGRDDVQQFLVKYLEDPYLLVQLAVVRSLGSFADERAADALLPLTTGDRDGRLKRAAEEAIRKIRKGMDVEFPQRAADKK